MSLGLEAGWRERLVDAAAPRDGQRILDVATGTGLVARRLRARAPCQVVGVDLTPGMLSVADRDGVLLALGRAEQLPFGDARFDGLTFTYLLRYVDDPAATLRELARVVRPGGRIASLEFHVPRNPLLKFGWWLYTRLALPLIGRAFSPEWAGVGAFLGRSISAFYRRHSLRDVEAMWRAAGIDDVRSVVLGLGAAVVTSGTRAGSVSAGPPAPIRPAFYALAPGGWRDYLTLLHPPYLAWHLSYVVLGASLAPALHAERLVATLLAFGLALGVGVHALDELNGRPLGTRIPDFALRVLAVLGLGAGVAIGIVGATVVSPSLLAFVLVGVLLALAYPLELAGGKLHSDLWFAVGWGAFPLVTAYWAQALEPSMVVLAGAGFAVATSYAQRRLSTWVRVVRRRAVDVRGELRLSDGERVALDADRLIAAPESALRWLALACVLIALAALFLRLS